DECLRISPGTPEAVVSARMVRHGAHFERIFGGVSWSRSQILRATDTCEVWLDSAGKVTKERATPPTVFKRAPHTAGLRPGAAHRTGGRNGPRVVGTGGRHLLVAGAGDVLHGRVTATPAARERTHRCGASPNRDARPLLWHRWATSL